MRYKLHIKKLFIRLKPALMLFILLSIPVTAFQNCGDVQLTKQELESLTGNSTAEGVSYLDIDNTGEKQFRAAFFVDMSNSMFSGPCPDSVDVWLPNVPPSENCIAPTGVDPEGKRWEIILNWLEDLKQKIQEGKIRNNQLKVYILPFSYQRFEEYLWNISKVNEIFEGTGISFNDQFLRVNKAIQLAQIYWAMESYHHEAPFSPRIPIEITNVVEENMRLPPLVPNNSNPSSGTSIPATRLIHLKNKLNQELNNLKTAGQLKTSHFEVSFLSDGVPKPHALHIKAAIEKIWLVKDRVCDATVNQASTRDCTDPYPGVGETGFINLDTELTGELCKTRCESYLQTYIDTGSVDIPRVDDPVCTESYTLPPHCSKWSDGSRYKHQRWGENIKCGLCMDLVEQYDGTYGYAGVHREMDHFREDTTKYWGDWILNRHSNILRKLEDIRNLFNKTYAGSYWRFNFVRVDSSTEEYKTPAGELHEDINWFVMAKKFFQLRHRFKYVKSNQQPFELFFEVSDWQKYSISSIYAYNRNLRLDYDGKLKLDSDGDGIFDEKEESLGFNKLKARTDGLCLDGIKAVYGECLSIGCNKNLDFDGDGLNQCEESTLGTNQFHPDTDGDSILDGAEILFGLNPVQNDHDLDSNNDGEVNYAHFTRGASPMLSYSSVEPLKLVSLSSKLVDVKKVVNDRNQEYLISGYEIQLKSMPIQPTLAVSGVHAANVNQVVLVARVENFKNPQDILWMYKVYEFEDFPEVKTIDLSEFSELDMGAP